MRATLTGLDKATALCKDQYCLAAQAAPPDKTSLPLLSTPTDPLLLHSSMLPAVLQHCCCWLDVKGHKGCPMKQHHKPCRPFYPKGSDGGKKYTSTKHSQNLARSSPKGPHREDWT